MSVIACRTFAPGWLIVAFGLAVSRCQVQEAGDASVLPAASVARTSNVWELSLSPPTLFGLVHGAKAAPSTLHSKLEPGSVEVNVNAGAATLDGSAGLPTMFVSGAVRSTSTLRMSLEAWPALSVATAASA